MYPTSHHHHQWLTQTQVWNPPWQALAFPLTSFSLYIGVCVSWSRLILSLFSPPVYTTVFFSFPYDLTKLQILLGNISISPILCHISLGNTKGNTEPYERFMWKCMSRRKVWHCGVNVQSEIEIILQKKETQAVQRKLSIFTASSHRSVNAWITKQKAFDIYTITHPNYLPLHHPKHAHTHTNTQTDTRFCRTL